MGIDSYLHTSLSPYTLNSDAMTIIAELQETFSIELEQKALILINAATLHPSMSHYQLSLTHKALGDCYYKYEYFGSALEQYSRALTNNKNLPIKRRISKIHSLPAEEQRVSQSPDMVDDVLKYPEYRKMVDDDVAKRKRMSNTFWVGHEETKQILDEVRTDIAKDALLEDSIIDSVHEAEIERRLEVLGEPYKSWFYKGRKERLLTKRPDDPISLKQYDLMELQNMERVKESTDPPV